jgi:hypothetical protein
MDSIEFRGVMPIPDAAIEVIKTGQERLAENRAAIFVSDGGAAIDQANFVADGNGAFRFYCEDRVDIYYGDAVPPVWTDVLIGPGLIAGGTLGQILAKKSATDFDIDWIDPPAGGGGGGEWEPIETQEVTTAGIDEFLFSDLDFDTYEYRIECRTAATGGYSGLRWYSFEPDAASVVLADYTANSLKATYSYNDAQTAGNYICYTFADSIKMLVCNAFFRKDFDGVLWGYCVDGISFNTVVFGKAIMTVSAAFGHTTGATKVGIYITGREFVVGSKMKLYRRPRL